VFGMGIAKGMATTLRHFFGKKSTIQYPEERAPLPIGFRGLPRLVYDEDPEDLRCVACSICANACPVNVIHIDTHRGADRKLVLDRFDIEAGGCIFCGLCVEACPFEALTMMRSFELAAYNREQLFWTKEMLAIKATPTTIADMDRIHGPVEKKEAAPPSAGAPPGDAAPTSGPDGPAATTEPAKTMAAAVPGNTGGERSAAIAEQEPAPPPAEKASEDKDGT
jgi:NADH-quinone oxidoreductase subunit I